MTTEDVARRYSSRPGYTLVSYGEVGLPYYRIQLRVEVLDRKQIGPFAEFLLRSVDLGIDEPDELEELLGLDERVLEANVVDLLGSDDLHVGRRDEGGQTGLLVTPKGRRTLETAVSIVPEEVIIEIDYDGLLQRPVPFLDRWYTPIELKETGAREVPPARVRPPELPKLQQQIEAVEGVIRAVGERRAARRDLLALKAIERRRRVFQTAVALVYRSDDDASIQVAFAIDGRLSDEHEQAFAQSKLLRKMGVGVDGLQNAEDIFVELLGADLVEAARHTEAPHPEGAAGAEPVDAQPALEVAEPVVDALSPTPSTETTVAPTPVVLPEVAFVETYDHPGYLRQALNDSRSRLLIVSPWVRGAVVNRAFLEQLEALLAAGIDVYIGWGIRPLDEEDDDADRSVQRAFEKLGERYRWNFKYKRLGHTHAKVLISDSRFMIVTSFNWLSFKGDPARTFRDERGILVSRAEEIDRQFEEWVRRFGTLPTPLPAHRPEQAGRPKTREARVASPAVRRQSPSRTRSKAPTPSPLTLRALGNGVEISWARVESAARIRVEIVSADGEAQRTRVPGTATQVRVGDLKDLPQPLVVTLRATDTGGREVRTVWGTISLGN